MTCPCPRAAKGVVTKEGLKSHSGQAVTVLFEVLQMKISFITFQPRPIFPWS